ncbi:unnamed protein product [Tuber aestivum]|uniref:Uncharacterized protein n=1 Tax=Tuber aestivum TaxID=59557 RepID=A0A292PY80_9PEZI|nr:unnamed protein product [Tuber aestivum]
MSSQKRVWLVTGTTSGIGENIALEALARGDLVVASSRNPSRLTQLTKAGARAVKIDQNQDDATIRKEVEEALAVYGRIDILVNNAAYVHTGTIEETTDEELKRQFQANVFGPTSIIRALLPHMRSRRSGVIANIGSMASWFPVPACNLYDASKAALRLIGDGLDSELARFGIKTTTIEPGMFRTELLDPNVNFIKTSDDKRIEDYREMNETTDALFRGAHGKQSGNPKKGAEVIYEVLTQTGIAQGREVPLVLALGSDAVSTIQKFARDQADLVKSWGEVSSSTDFA